MTEVAWDVLKARELWADLSIGTGAIAASLGISKNTLCGYAKRNRDAFPPRVANHRGVNSLPAAEKSRYGAIAYKNRGLRKGESASQRNRRKRSNHGPHYDGPVVIKKTLPPLASLAPRAAKSPSFPPPSRAPEPTFVLPANLSSRCCYVVDDTRMQQRYCDAPAPLGSSWCVEHARKVFVSDHFPDWCAKHHVRVQAVAA